MSSRIGRDQVRHGRRLGQPRHDERVTDAEDAGRMLLGYCVPPTSPTRPLTGKAASICSAGCGTSRARRQGMGAAGLWGDGGEKLIAVGHHRGSS